MGKSFYYIAPVALVQFMAPTAAQSRLTAEDDAAATALAEQLLSAADSLPAGTLQPVYAARFAVIIAAYPGRCEVVLAAIAKAMLRAKTPVIRQALGEVRAQAARCQRGTGVGQNRADAPPSLPGLNTGGGVNYTL